MIVVRNGVYGRAVKVTKPPEEAGFSYSRPKGMSHCVMTATVAPAGH
jgi:hypothetical protein